ncbi:hypothetical protein NQ315_005722 [Exocentrus adspersus]|uniref:Uncharacterized protein n=1 Tax=Exocentrus adspersus TaxID=1586481 RepID=A0AAV8VIH5_9CUCU|nr:hypothetical protein NQ315_005722 [Exocentrus adspersus]
MPDVFFTFCEGTTATADSISLIKENIRKIRQTGLRIICRISDQGATNYSAINRLLEETRIHYQDQPNRYQGYVIDDEEIVHLYDFPHLMKGIRNCLDRVNKIACWDYVVTLYRMDKKRGIFSQFRKLTDEHVIPNKIKKNAREILVNGYLLNPSRGKHLRSVVTSKTNHVSFWYSSLPVLESMYFSPLSDPQKCSRTSSIKNWSFSIHDDLPEHILITERQYPGCTLHHPSTAFSKTFSKTTELILSLIPQNKTNIINISIISQKEKQKVCLLHIVCIMFFCRLVLFLIKIQFNVTHIVYFIPKDKIMSRTCTMKLGAYGKTIIVVYG